MIYANQLKLLSARIHHKITGDPINVGSINIVIRLESQDTDNGKYWNGSAWVSTATEILTTHLAGGLWGYVLGAAATNGKTGGFIHYFFTSDLTDAGNDIAINGGGEHPIVNDVPAGILDVKIYESEPRSV